jgi:hypothetical protein
MERVLFDSVRDANPFFHFMEALWILAGRSDVEWLAQWLPSIADYSDDGVSFHGAYGMRLNTHGQLTQVIERLQQLHGRVTELKSLGRRVELIVFASAHGKAGALHLAGTKLALVELRRLALECGADLTITIVDACESGLSRNKGAQRGPAYELEVRVPQVSGEVFIASSGASESAQEWDVLSGSLFTHHLLTALRGDGDLDQQGRADSARCRFNADHR